MNRPAGWALVVAMAAATAGTLLAPPWVCALTAVGAFAALRTGRKAFVAFTVVTVAVNALLFALLLPGPDAAPFFGPISVDASGALVGITGALRLAAVLGVNLAVLSWVPAAVLLDGLRLPVGLMAFLGAVLIAAHDLGRDAARLMDAARLDGRWPRGLLAKVRAAASLLPPLAVLALRRSRTRAEALRLAGHDTGPRFAPLVAVTAMAVAGRLAFVAVPNVSLAYAVVFVAGLVFGSRVGALAGLLGMAITNVLLTGLYLVPFANAPAMALVGALGGLLRRVDFTGRSPAERWAGRLLAASCGLAATVLFSVAADLATWAVVTEYRDTPGSLRALVLAGLAFNVLAAAVNAVLFAAAVGPVSVAARSAGVLLPDAPPPRST
ncbi:MAG TPA: ECF transporter S component [Candidatus Thermoplasmatota archaeon]|nr:ECF transporter S component [Candidatus Thermoplasmatota archaeon]